MTITTNGAVTGVIQADQAAWLASSVSGGVVNKLGNAVEQSYAAWPGLLIDALSSTSGWTLTQTNGSIAADTLSNGVPCIKFTANGAGAPNLLMTKDLGSIPYDSSTSFGCWVEVSDPGIIANIQVMASNEAAGVFTNWRLFGFGTSGGAVNRNQIYFIVVNTANSSVGGGTPAAAGLWKSFRIRVISSYQNRAGWIKIGRLMSAPTARPKISITFDDGYASQYYEAFRYMSKYGITGTIGVTQALVNTANYCTTAQLQAMYAAGWAMVSHATNHVGFNGTGDATLPNSIAQAQTPAGAGALTLNGSVGTATFDAPRHVCVRAASDQGRMVTIVGLDAAGGALSEDVYTWTGGNPVPTLNLFSKVTSVSIDAAATGTITVGQSRSVAEMTSQITTPRDWLIANGMPNGAYDWIYPNGEFNTSSTALMSTLGMRSARVVNGQGQSPQMGDFRKYELPGYGGGGAALTGAAMLVYVDAAIAEGRNTGIYLHEIIQTGSPTSTQTMMSELITFIDGCATRAAAGKCDFVTQTQLPVA